MIMQQPSEDDALRSRRPYRHVGGTKHTSDGMKHTIASTPPAARDETGPFFIGRRPILTPFSFFAFTAWWQADVGSDKFGVSLPSPQRAWLPDAVQRLTRGVRVERSTLTWTTSDRPLIILDGVRVTAPVALRAGDTIFERFPVMLASLLADGASAIIASTYATTRGWIGRQGGASQPRNPAHVVADVLFTTALGSPTQAAAFSLGWRTAAVPNRVASAAVLQASAAFGEMVATDAPLLRVVHVIYTPHNYSVVDPDPEADLTIVIRTTDWNPLLTTERSEAVLVLDSDEDVLRATVRNRTPDAASKQ